MNDQIEKFIKEFCKELSENNAAVFAGAGMSKSAGFVDWKQLLKDFAEELSLDINKEHDLISLAQYHCNENGGNRSCINQKLLTEFCQDAQITENHKILARLPITTYWTTNYDSLIEESLKSANKIADVKHEKEQLAITMPGRDATVYKMHGDVKHPHKAIITKDDYEKYPIERGPFITALSGDLVSKTFLFIGFGFTDPNLDYILSRIRGNFSGHQRQHYCFMKKIQGKGVKVEYDKRKQELFINDLKRFNIKTLLIDDYSQITEILGTIEELFKQNTIFISGSAHKYGKWTEEKAQTFIHKLSEQLIKKDYSIISGFGLGVGSFVINGALSEIYSHKHKRSRDRLILRPFPQKKTGHKELNVLWEEYRQEMISEAGIAIFLFGNKESNGNVVNANGAKREFEIAKDKGLKLIPVGATGYIAEELWMLINKDFDSYFPKAKQTLKRNFKVIGDSNNSSSKLITAVLNIIDELNRI
jgi:hypothetical protein